MAITHEPILYDATGNYIKIIDDYVSFQYARGVNVMGTFSMALPSYYYPLIQKDYQIRNFRTPDNGKKYLEGETSWLVRTKGKSLDNSGKVMVNVGASDGMHLLTRRFVIAFAGSAAASKSGAADNVVKAIVNEQMGTGAAAALRRLATTFFNIQPNLTLLPSITKEFAWRNVLAVLQEIAQDSYTNGSFMAFDIVWYGPSSGGYYEFRTYKNQRGVNRSRSQAVNAPVVLSTERNQLSEAEVTIDWENEITRAFAAGAGEGTDRYLTQVADDTRIASPAGRIEDFLDARNGSTDAAVLAEANARLRERRAKKIVTANYSNSSNIKWGVDIGLGDIVTLDVFNENFDVRIDAYSITVEAGKPEQIDLKFQYEGFV